MQNQNVATVTTLIEPAARTRVDVATEGCFTAIHAGSVSDAVRSVREEPVRVLLVSPTWIRPEEIGHLGQMIRDFPGVPTIALISRHDYVASERLLELGVCGVRRMVDVSNREGWIRLRHLVTAVVPPATNRILNHVIRSLDDAAPDAKRIFEMLVLVAPLTTTVRTLCRQLRVQPTTLMSRFDRAGMPSPKRYLSAVRLLYAAALFEIPGLSIGDVAYRLNFSSPQSFARHVRCVVGVTGREFRERYPFSAALNDFTERFILPYRAAFRTFHPL
jgi:AraC-like DNA-binding protein